jgi:large subunit ribosomal protein L17
MSMLRNLAVSLINAREERIVTTLPKAKELRPFVEKAITLSRKASNLEGDDTGARALHLRRQAAGFFHAGNMQAVALTGKRGQARLPRTAGVAALRRLFDELGERYKDRPGGYTRIFKLGRRAGDNAELAIIELVDNQGERDALEAAKKRKSAGPRKKKAETKSGDRGSAAQKETADATAKASDKSESINASADTTSEEPAETAAVDTGEPESVVTEES